MKLHLEHHFPGDPALYWQAYNDDALDQKMASAGNSTREQLSRDVADGVVTLVQRFHIDIDLPTAVRKLIGSDRLSYDQQSVIDEANNRIQWKVTPPVQQDRVKAEGVVTITPTAEGVTRVIDGDVIVKVPLVGGQIEKAIVNAIEQGYSAAAEVQKAWMAERA